MSIEALHHHVRRMSGRDPHEANRTSTPLEALFDLTFATSFSLAASNFAHALTQGHYHVALFGFALASFGICVAWINFSWFSSAYDTDDWIFRLVTMLQMIGVLILATGVPRMFASLEHGAPVDNSVMVFGYVVMRVAMVSQWLRAARQDPPRQRICLTYATIISIAQVGWVTQILFNFSLSVTIVLSAALVLIELGGPIIAERKDGGTPWHAHHMAERYGLFAIIALGEGVVGTVATIASTVEVNGWTLDTALVCLAGTGLTFGLWWVYYMLPSAEVLHAHRSRAFVWAYGQIIIIASIVATGAGLDVAADVIKRASHIGPVAALLASAVPVSVFLVMVYALYYWLVRQFDTLHIWLLTATAAVVLAAITAAVSGVAMAVCLVILMLAPAVTVIGYEIWGHRHKAAALANDLRLTTR